MSGLFQNLPTTITAGGVEIPIKWDFRASILFETAMQDLSLSFEAQTEAILKAYFGSEAITAIGRLVAEGKTEEFFSEIFRFYSCGRGPEPKHGEETKPGRPVYSFEHDENRIYAAFLEQYGMDLYTAENLHWWKFRAMFTNLPESCEIVRIMQIRGRPIDSSMPPKERRALRQAKAAYALPDLRTAEQIEADFAEGFSMMF